jgi:hypothetical protein
MADWIPLIAVAPFLRSLNLFGGNTCPYATHALAAMHEFVSLTLVRTDGVSDDVVAVSLRLLSLCVFRPLFCSPKELIVTLMRGEGRSPRAARVLHPHLAQPRQPRARCSSDGSGHRIVRSTASSPHCLRDVYYGTSNTKSSRAEDCCLKY